MTYRFQIEFCDRKFPEAVSFKTFTPGEVLKVAHDLGFKRLLPVHSSRFVLSRHPWNEPLAKISELNGTFNIPLVMGEPVYLGNEKQPFRQWWRGVE